MMNSLKGELSLKVGPLVLEVLVRHWFNRLKKECSTGENEDPVDVGARLKEDDILYHEAFVIVKVSKQSVRRLDLEFNLILRISLS